MKRTNNILWGIIFIFVGCIIGFNALGFTNINLFFDGWWTLFIIIPSLISIFTEKDKTGNIIGLLVGVALLLACQDIISFKLIGKLLLPVILIFIGVSIIFKDQIGKTIRKEIKKINTDNNKEYTSVFGSENVNITDEFEGANISAVFGETKINMKDCKISKDVLVNASAIFGSTTIYVPEGVNVIVTGSPLFGSIENKVVSNGHKNTLYISCTAMFGGIEIK